MTRPDVEAMLVQVLTAAAGVPVLAKSTGTLPAEYVRVRRVGGTAFSPAHDRPLVLVECYGASQARAHDIAAAVRGASESLDVIVPGLGHVAFLGEVGGLADYPDPLTASPRYQFTHQFQTRSI